MSKKIVIIGVGVSGLSAGCYAAMNGYDVEIHEAHNLPGGLCTAWKRHDYTVDGCIHWLMGTRLGDDHYRIWEELGVIPELRMLDHEIFAHVVSTDGRTLHWFADVDRLETHLLDLAPQDALAIGKLCTLIRKLATLPMPVDKPAELMNFVNKAILLARMTPYLRYFLPVANLSLCEFSLRFSDPFLRDAIAHYLYDPNMPVMALLITQGKLSRKSAGYPLGGSMALARILERRLLDPGEHIVYRSRVNKMLERGARVIGVSLSPGDEVPADFQRRHSFVPKTVPGLEGLCLASMWTHPPGGVVGASAVGRAIIQILCHEDRKHFRTTTPK